MIYATDPLDVLFELYVASAIAERRECDCYVAQNQFAKCDILAVRDNAITGVFQCKRRPGVFEQYPTNKIEKHGLDVAKELADANGCPAILCVGDIEQDKALFRWVEIVPSRFKPCEVYRRDRPEVNAKPGYEIFNGLFKQF